jgi:hypothetical protein
MRTIHRNLLISWEKRREKIKSNTGIVASHHGDQEIANPVILQTIGKALERGIVTKCSEMSS